MKKRLIAVMLVCFLLIGAMPVRAETADEKEALRDHMQSMYYRICYMSGLGAMNGYCGLMVGCQLYLLGIDSSLQSRDGKYQYNAYCGLEVTTGGYPVRAYPDYQYSLTEVLNHLTNYGTRDVYNILVGFESTSSSASGAVYGHAMFIHAVLDGEVYFMDNFGIFYDGWTHPTGYPNVMSIEQFGTFYESWADYEGCVYFGKGYANEDCSFYPADLLLQATEPAPLYTQPSAANGILLRTAAVGEQFHAVGLFETCDGNLYYAAEENGNTVYIPADQTAVTELLWNSIEAADMTAPESIRRGKGFILSGAVRSDAFFLETVTVQILRRDDGSQVLSCRDRVFAPFYNLRKLDNRVHFSDLDTGDYLYRVTATVSGNYAENGKLQTQTQELVLWTSQFSVGKTNTTHTVTLDPSQGTCELAWAVRQTGETLGPLPQPQRDGYRFDGWFLEDGSKADEATVVTHSLTLQARWTQMPSTGWCYTSDGWRYMTGGQYHTGWLRENGIYYYFDEQGLPATGWREADGQLRFFSDSGAMATGWISRNGGTSYLQENGTVATGWIQADGKRLFADGDGMLLTGWTELDGSTYHFNSDGSASTGWTEVDGTVYCFSAEGVLSARIGSNSSTELYNPVTGSFVPINWQSIPNA